VRSKIADLRTMERVLSETVARCADGAGSHCPLIDRLYREGLQTVTPADPSEQRRRRGKRRANRSHARRSLRSSP
jgi:hypothetical protein